MSTDTSWMIMQSAAVERTETDARRVGYRVYVPRYRKLISPHGADRRSAVTIRPVFDGVLFVQDWRGWPKQTIGGEPRLMRAHRKGDYAKLSAGDIELMMRKEIAREYDDVKYAIGDGRPVLRDDLTIGGQVSFERFGDRVVGVLEELSENGMAFVRAHFLGREIKIAIAARELDAVA